MKICHRHWEQLRDACASRGMAHLVSETPEQAEIERQLAGDDTNFDPLLRANFMIWGEAVRTGGPYVMGFDEHGKEFCPICEAIENIAPEDLPDKRYSSTEQYWTEGVMDSILQYARDIGLMPPLM
jgi:hypothetical protein